MDKLSNELIAEIFSKLSQRYLATCSLVCKVWLSITRQQRFCSTVELNSTRQIEKFIVFAQRFTIDKLPLSLCVKQIVFNVENIKDLNPYKLVVLINLCPFVNKVNQLPNIKEENHKLLLDTNYWRCLSDIPLSYTMMDNRWLDHMDYLSRSVYNDDKNKITSVSFDMSTSQFNKLSIQEYSKMISDDERHRRILLIENQINCQLPIRSNDFIHITEINIIFNSYYIKLPPSFINLKKLYLDFKVYNKIYNHCYYEFNETTLESISATCPSLNDLTLHEFNFNLSDNFTPSSSPYINFRKIEPSPQLQYLYLDCCHLHEPGCYKYIQYKYPNLIKLQLDLMYFPIMNELHSQYKSAIGDLITSYDSTLTGLKVDFLYKCTSCYQGKCYKRHIIGDQRFWPHKELLTWLIAHPNQLTTLYYPFDLFTIEKGNNDWETALVTEDSLSDDQKKRLLSQCRSYLNHLTTLKITFEQPPKYTLKYLLYQNFNKQIVSLSSSLPSSSSLQLSVESLIVAHYHHFYWNSQQSKFKFYIYDWLNTLPSLKKLEIAELWLQHDHQLVYPYPSEQHIITIPKTTLSYTYPYYQLSELHFTLCRICFDLSEMTTLLKSLIHLKALFMNTVWFTAQPTAESFIISAPHLNFSFLQLSKIKYDQFSYLNSDGRSNESTQHYTYYIQNIKVKETISNNCITKKNIFNDDWCTPSNLLFNFVCRSVDNLYT